MGSKKGFYERYKIERKNKEIEQQLRKKYDISDDKQIVIEQTTKFDQIWKIGINFILTIYKITIYLILLVLSSIGATVLVNASLREVFFELIETII